MKDEYFKKVPIITEDDLPGEAKKLILEKILMRDGSLCGDEELSWIYQNEEGTEKILDYVMDFSQDYPYWRKIESPKDCVGVQQVNEVWYWVLCVPDDIKFAPITLSSPEELLKNTPPDTKTSTGENAWFEETVLKLMKWFAASTGNADSELAIEDYKEVFEDHKRLVREIDVIINGENAAKQASLCDLVGQIKKLVVSKDVAGKEGSGTDYKTSLHNEMWHPQSYSGGNAGNKEKDELHNQLFEAYAEYALILEDHKIVCEGYKVIEESARAMVEALFNNHNSVLKELDISNEHKKDLLHLCGISSENYLGH